MPMSEQQLEITERKITEPTEQLGLSRSHRAFARIVLEWVNVNLRIFVISPLFFLCLHLFVLENDSLLITS